MTKVVSIKVPDDMAILQSRLTATAKAAQIPVWELMSRMLDDWEKKASNSEAPAGSGWAEWRTAIESEVQSLKAELAATKAQERNNLLVNQRNDDIVLVPEESEAESQVSLPVNQDDDIKAFEAAYVSLEHDRHTLIWKLRERLGWPNERFDTALCQLRDSGRFQPMQGAETKGMTKEQLKSAFVDENGFRHHIVMRAPAKTSEPMNETDSGKAAPISSSATRKPQKKKTTEDTIIPSAEAFKTILDKAKASEESSVPALRRRGRPPKTMKVDRGREE
jgi:hypothetical protein